MVKFHHLSPLNKNLKEAEMENGSYIVGVTLCDIELRKNKLSWDLCVLKNFPKNTVPHSCFLNVAGTLKTSECFSCTTEDKSI